MREFVIAADRHIVGFGPVKALIGQADKSVWPREALIGLKLIAPDSPECESVRSESSLTDAAQGHDRIRFFLKERLLRNFRDVARAFLDEAGPCAIEVTSAELLDEGSRAFFEALAGMPRAKVTVTMTLGASGAGAMVNTSSAAERRIDDTVRGAAPSEGDLDFLYEQAIRYLSVGDSWTAVRILQALLPHRGTPAVWGRLGLGYAMLGRSLEAEFCYVRWREDADPVSSAGASYALSMLYARHHPAHLRSLDRTARFLEEGYAVLEKADEETEDLEFHMVFNRNGYALVEFRRGRVNEAVAHLTNGIEKLRNGSAKNRMHQTVLIYNLAQCYRRVGDNVAAIETYQQLLEVDGKMPEYHMELAHCYMDAGRTDDALASLLTARELGPSILEVHSLLGYVYLQSGDMGNAELSYRAAHECDERDFDALYDYAYVLAESERPREALTVVEGRSLEGLDAEQQARLLTLAAEQHAGLGDLPAARTALERVLVLTPDDHDARANLDRVLKECA
ncbi:tetratricopeptide repeat protein [Streptomyces sp. NPDC085665]|uniref:tetratricopeptide repeat protein n=1 Tax=Streptomyces sp. NPDC085665 TaxID=3365735 RepID=UPI0037D7C4A6